MSNIDTRAYALGTTLTVRYPFGFYVSARALCADGKVRTVTRISQTADTFFSVPAAVKVQGKTVSGYVTVETVSGSSVEADEDPACVKFRAYTYGRNAHLLDECQVTR